MSPEHLDYIAKQGPFAVLLLIAIAAIVYLYKGRMADWREIADTIKMFTGTLRDWVGANEPRTRALEANVRALELLTSELVTLRTETASLRETIIDRTGEAIRSNREMREAVIALREQVATLYTRCLRGPSGG